MIDGGGGVRLALGVVRMKYLSPSVALSKACVQRTDLRRTLTFD